MVLSGFILNLRTANMLDRRPTERDCYMPSRMETTSTTEMVAANNSGVSSNSARQVPQSRGIPLYDGTQHDKLGMYSCGKSGAKVARAVGLLCANRTGILRGMQTTRREFSVIIERDSAGYYVALVPELKGCHTQAKSLDTLMKRVREAIELCLEVEGDRAGMPEFVGVQRIAV